jgi:histidine triad (HIT) family protein
MNECVFCKIVSGDIPSEILFENEQVVAILDINPIHFGHALVVPRKHFRDFLELEPQCYPSLLDATRIVSSALVRGLGLEGFNLFSNNGRIAGQSVLHFHLHVTPRYPDDDIRFVLKLKKYENGKMKQYADLIRNHIEHS